MKFVRYGGLSPKGKQKKRWENAPANRGIWAFPFPFRSRWSFAINEQYWKKNNPEKLNGKLKRVFEYNEMLYTRLDPNGRPTFKWFYVSTEEFERRWRKLNGRVRALVISNAHREKITQCKHLPWHYLDYSGPWTNYIDWMEAEVFIEDPDRKSRKR